MSATTSPWIINVTEENFQQAVIETSHQKPVVLDFWADWCEPCLTLSGILEPLIDERQGEIILAKINVDECRNLAAYFQIKGIPAIKAVRNGALVLEFTGVLPEQHLRAFLDRLTPTEAERLAAEAEEEEEPAEAEQRFREALAKDNTNQEARVGLARALLSQNKTAEILEILEPVGSGGDLGAEVDRIKAVLDLRQLARDFGTEAQARQRLAANPGSSMARYELGCVLAASGQYEKALELLMAAAEEDYKLAPTKIRDAMVKIFYALGSSHPLADEYRARLARLLY